MSFSPVGAWHFIADCLEDLTHPLEEIVLEKPPGARGFVLKIPLPSGDVLYVKLELSNGKVIGRSFHLSDHKRQQ
ncbi:MAG: hypothetical protein AMXMBFR55_23910 [Gemmatimonadota bacterium]